MQFYKTVVDDVIPLEAAVSCGSSSSGGNAVENEECSVTRNRVPHAINETYISAEVSCIRHTLGGVARGGAGLYMHYSMMYFNCSILVGFQGLCYS